SRVLASGRLCAMQPHWLPRQSEADVTDTHDCEDVSAPEKISGLSGILICAASFAPRGPLRGRRCPRPPRLIRHDASPAPRHDGYRDIRADFPSYALSYARYGTAFGNCRLLPIVRQAARA